MPTPVLLFALTLMASDASAAPPTVAGEPLPAGAPTEDYPLTAWCYGAMSEYLSVYERVKPDLRAIDKMWGSSVPDEKEPYADDMAAARQELQVLAGAVEAAEKASPSPIAPQGVQAVHLGRSIWAPAEGKTSRELARAWLSWALPDRCDATARALASKSALLGQALKYNTGDTAPVAGSAPTAPAAPEPTPPPAPDNSSSPAAPPLPVEAAPLPPVQTPTPALSAPPAPAAATAPPASTPPASAGQAPEPAQAAPAAAVPAPPAQPSTPPAAEQPASAQAPTVDSILGGGAPAPGPASTGAEPQPAPEIAPSPQPTILPPSQPDPNGPIPDPAPQPDSPKA